MSVAILGAGAFGTALAIALGAGGPVTLWARDAGAVARLRDTRQTPRLPNAVLDDTITVTDDLYAAASANVLLLAVPMQAMAGFLDANAGLLDGKPLVACAKGVDLTTLRGPSALITSACPAAVPAVLTGPSFAADIARGLPTALTLACANAPVARQLQKTLSAPALRLYRTADVTGAELGGALKNVIAIGAGIVMGAGLGDSARAALMTRGYAEMVRLALSQGAQAETLAGLSGLGDLVLTCTSPQSRNFRHGFALGRGEGPETGATVEGLATARAVASLARRAGVDVPVTDMVAALCNGSLTVPAAMTALLSRPLKEE